MDERTDAARLLGLIAASRTDLRQRTTLNDRFVCRLLAVTYLLGFGGQYLVATLAPQLTAPASFILVLVGSAAVFVILAHSFSQYHGVRGRAARRPSFFGAAWLIALVLTLTATVLISVLFPVVDVLRIAYVISTVLIGLMYAAVGLALGGRMDLTLGCWLVGTGVVAGLTPMPTTMLVIALLAGLGFFLASRSTAHADPEAAR